MKLSVCVDTDYKYPQRSSVMITAMDSVSLTGNKVLISLYRKFIQRKKKRKNLEPVLSRRL